MKKTSVNKEELLTMLTEIYDQLEELEAVFQSSLTDHKNCLYVNYTDKLSACENRLSALEKDMGYIEKNGINNRSGSNKGMMLELGY